MTIEKYNRLNTLKKDSVVYKRKRYHIDPKDATKVVCDGELELWKLMRKKENKTYNIIRHTSKNYKSMEVVLGANPKHKSITCNMNICDSVKDMAKENVSLEYLHAKRHLRKQVDTLIPHQTRATTVLKHMARENANQFTTDINGNLITA